MEEADGAELTVGHLTTRVILVIFAAIHVSANMNSLSWTLNSLTFTVDIRQRTFESPW